MIPPLMVKQDADKMLFMAESYLKILPESVKKKVSMEIVNLAYSRLEEYMNCNNTVWLKN